MIRLVMGEAGRPMNLGLARDEQQGSGQPPEDALPPRIGVMAIIVADRSCSDRSSNDGKVATAAGGVFSRGPGRERGARCNG